jgi:hypothetical protein
MKKPAKKKSVGRPVKKVKAPAKKIDTPVKRKSAREILREKAMEEQGSLEEKDDFVKETVDEENEVESIVEQDLGEDNGHLEDGEQGEDEEEDY